MSELKLQGKIALVTGGASGIGEATVRMLAAEGAGVAILDRDEEGARRVAGEVEARGVPALALAIDLADMNVIAPAVETVISALGHIDILVNVAGITGEMADILEFREEGWDEVYSINLKAPLFLMQEVGRHMAKRGGGGRIVNVSSSTAFRAYMAPLAYSTSKAALCQLTRVVAAQLAQYDINVNAVAPGVTETPINQAAGKEMLKKLATEGPMANMFQRVSEARDVAEAVVFLCLPGSRQITAQTLHTSAGSVL
jgi:NAD(P)-dependent dehydrogenase (short-subunit alcohol dehydrogenase family)